MVVIFFLPVSRLVFPGQLPVLREKKAKKAKVMRHVKFAKLFISNYLNIKTS